jgi:CDGSH-type Zn-finger protein
MHKVEAYENACLVMETGGSFVVKRDDGSEEVVEKDTVALCRCGQSSNKPFCDGTHALVGFTAPGVSLEVA